jgi:hypothetical protein
VKKAFRTVCLREPKPDAGDAQAVDSLVGTFNAAGNMKRVFAEAAAYCASHL